MGIRVVFSGSHGEPLNVLEMLTAVRHLEKNPNEKKKENSVQSDLNGTLKIY